MAVFTTRNIPVLDRKEWQMMTPPPVAATNGVIAVPPPSHIVGRYPVLYLSQSTIAHLYSPEEDAWCQIASPALAGTFGSSGQAGAFSPWSITYTATGGSTTTVTVSAASFPLTSVLVGKTIEFLNAGIATGQRRVITNVEAGAGAGAGTITLTLESAVATAILNTHTFRVSSGRYFVSCAGNISLAGAWKAFDLGTYTWQPSLSTTGLPISWTTDAHAICTARFAPVYANGTATSGSTTTLVDTAANWGINQWAGQYVLLVSGTNAGQCLKILSNTATTLTFATASAPDNTTVYQIRGLSALAVGKATSGSATTVVNSGKAWATNQWTNYQCRIISGTGAGQIKKIASNTATTLTIASGATIDSTSVYEIEPLEDSVYLLGNSAVTMYLYSISGNTWSTVTPTTARAAAAGAGCSANFVACTNDPVWGAENAIQDGRYIYSVRGSISSIIDRFDITGGTAGAGAWTQMTYPGAAETFTAGAMATYSGRYLYIRKEASNRFFKYDIPGNELTGFNTDAYPDGAATFGQKMWVRSLDCTEQIQWLYSMVSNSSVLRRVGII